jgi:hypothetical protein
MATAAIFILITNDGKQDRILMASDMLKQRLASVKQSRREANMQDHTPTLLDIERTHVLFMNAHFKPFAAIGFEYNRVTPDSGGATLGTDIRFSIPQFGDFFSDMALYLRFKKAEYVPTDGIDDNNKKVFRYCDYPGERLMQRVRFDVNGNALDEYNSDIYNLYRLFSIPPNKLLAWHRLVGQENPSEAFLEQESQVQPSSRIRLDYFDGYQTPKAEHEALVVMVPLLFWFNKDPRLAIPSVSIPFGQRYITITLPRASELIELVTPTGADGSDHGTVPALAIDECALYVNNIFVNPEVHDIFIKRIGFTLIRVHRTQTTRVKDDSSSTLLNNLKWPIEAMFVAIRPVENTTHVSTDNRVLQTWHQFSKVTYDTRDVDGVASSRLDTVAQNEIKRFLDVSILSTLAAQLAAYAALERKTAQGAALFSLAAAAATLVGATPASVHTAVYLANTNVYHTHPVKAGSSAQVIVRKTSPTIDRLSITVHGIDIYREMPAMFYHSYTPYTYGGQNIMAPSDVGAHMISFCLYPGVFQPSGHINVSRAREFYIKYWSNGAVSSESPGDLLVVASALNFLLVSDGSAVLRYTT